MRSWMLGLRRARWGAAAVVGMVSIVAQAGSTSSVSYQVSPDHAGEAGPGMTATFPLKRAWTADVGSHVDYALIAEGKVFVTTVMSPAGLESHQVSQLIALDRATGQVSWGPVSYEDPSNLSAIAYDAGRVYVLTYDGLVHAFSAASGSILWSVRLSGQYNFGTPPTAIDGRVFVTTAGYGARSDGSVYALDGQTGALLWTQPVEGNGGSSPAINDGGVFVSAGCDSYRFVEDTGALVWHHAGPCLPGGVAPPVYRGGKLYSGDGSGQILDGSTGDVIGTFSANIPPAIGATDGFFLTQDTLRAAKLDGMQTKWTFSSGYLSGPPLIIDRHVFMAHANSLYALDRETGRLIWQDSPEGGVGVGSCCSLPIGGFGVGEGLLVVPGSSSLITAYHIDETQPGAPMVRLSVTPYLTYVGGTVDVTWSSEGAAGCVASGDWVGNITPSGHSSVKLTREGDYSFAITCSNAAGSTTRTSTIHAAFKPTLSLKSSATDAVVSAHVMLTWNSSNARTCAASGDWTGSKPVSGNADVAVTRRGTNTYTLSCSGDGGRVTRSVAVVGVIPAVSFTVPEENTAKGDALGRSTNVLEIKLSRVSPTSVSVPFSVGGNEPATAYKVSPTGHVDIPAGQLAAAITVIVYGPKATCDRSITLTLQAPPNATLGVYPVNTLNVRNAAVPLCR